VNKEIIKRRAGNPTWIRNPEEAELVRQIHDQWCKENGYRITGHVPRAKRGISSNVSEIRQIRQK
jgi:hypothetical protein